MSKIDTAGRYKGRATEIMLTESKEKGTPGVQLSFVITDGPAEGSYINYSGWFSDTKMKNGQTVSEMVFANLYLCGWDDSSDPGNINMFSDRGLYGIDANEVELVIVLEPYSGKDESMAGKAFPRVSFINKLGGRGLNLERAMTATRATALGEAMRAVALKVRAKSLGADSGTDFPTQDRSPIQPKPAPAPARKF